MSRAARAALLLCAAALAAGCDRGGAGPASDADPDAAPPWDVAEPDPEPRPGMAWIPPGTLIAGTPPDQIPRVTDEEMAGEQVVMRGYYIDVFPYPNEAGAIPKSGVTQQEARDLCEARGKRLCTELEIERACKGPENTAYEYGDTYKASVCATGVARSLVPNGVNAMCVSAFGVHDLHGGVWTWTSSQWRRDASKRGLGAEGAARRRGARSSNRNLVTVRGGNGPAGELIGRCANGRGLRPNVHRLDVGARCCAGDVNSFEVVLDVTRGPPLRLQPPDDRVAGQLAQIAPEEVMSTTRGRPPGERLKIERVWVWHPIGNEELLVGGGCARPLGRKPVCGLIIGRARLDTVALVSFVPSDWWQPTLGEADSPRELFLYGGDHEGAFRRRVSYEWGRIGVSAKERKHKHKGRREPSFD